MNKNKEYMLNTLEEFDSLLKSSPKYSFETLWSKDERDIINKIRYELQKLDQITEKRPLPPPSPDFKKREV